MLEIEQCMSFMCRVVETHFAVMESLRVFKLLNMALWFGGTLSAKASQSMAFTAARRPAIFTPVKTFNEVMVIRNNKYRLQVKQTCPSCMSSKL